MKEATRDFSVGLFTLIGLIGLSVLLMRFGELDHLLSSRYELVIRMPQAAGLRNGSAVELNRIPVGVVRVVRVAPDDLSRVEVIAEIDKGIAIPSNVIAEVAAPLIGGGAVLNLAIPGGEQPAPPLASDGSARIASSPVSLIQELTRELDRRLEPMVKTLEKIDLLSDTYTNLGQQLTSLVEHQSESELAGGAPANLRTAITRFNQTLEDAQRSLRLAESWLGDEELREQVKAVVARADALIGSAAEAVDRYRLLADALEEDVDGFLAGVMPVADQIAATLEDVRHLARQAVNGRGTIGLLLNNPTLYYSLNDASLRLEQALIEFQLLVEQIKIEGIKFDF